MKRSFRASFPISWHAAMCLVVYWSTLRTQYIANDGIPKMADSVSPNRGEGVGHPVVKTEHPPQTCNESDVDFERIMPSAFVRCGEIVS